MEEQTIVINDLLSFAWCNLRQCSVPKEKLLKCIQNFYSKKYVLDALETLLVVLPTKISPPPKDPNPFNSIINLLDLLSNSENTDLPIFVCKDLNNVPDIGGQSGFTSSESDVPLEKILYEEHLAIKTELGELCGSLYDLKKQLRVMTSYGSDAGMEEEPELEEEEENPLRDFAVMEGSTTVRGDGEEDDENHEEDMIWFKESNGDLDSSSSLEDSSVTDEDDDEGSGEQRNLLIANRLKRNQRRADRGEKVIQLQKPIPLITKASSPAASRGEQEGGVPQGVSGTPAQKVSGSGDHTSKSKMADPSQLDTGKTYSCPDCHLTFNTFDALNIHKTSHFETDYRCPLCTKRFEEDLWLGHVKDCPGNGLTKREDVYCKECDIYFGEKKLLGYHIAYHDDSRPFQCLQCKYRFYTQKAVDDHFKMHSRPDYRHKCPFCNLRTPRLTRIKEHIRCHTGDKPFECHLCEYATTTYDTLKGHQKSHYPNAEFQCKECQKSYKTKNKLRFHERIHSKEKAHKCPVCGKGFNYGMCMTLHYRRHLGKKTHDCPQCSFKGNTGNQLRLHVSEMHPAKLPYQCGKCDFGASFKSYLNAHKKEVHPRKTNLLAEAKVKTEKVQQVEAMESQD